MKCPSCNCEMEDGQVRIAGSKLRLLFWGLSYQSLWFSSKHTPREEVLVPHSYRDAHRCSACGMLVVKYDGSTAAPARGGG